MRPLAIEETSKTENCNAMKELIQKTRSCDWFVRSGTADWLETQPDIKTAWDNCTDPCWIGWYIDQTTSLDKTRLRCMNEILQPCIDFIKEHQLTKDWISLTEDFFNDKITVDEFLKSASDFPNKFHKEKSNLSKEEYYYSLTIGKNSSLEIVAAIASLLNTNTGILIYNPMRSPHFDDANVISIIKKHYPNVI